MSGPGLDPPVVTSWAPDANRNLAELTHPLGGKEVFTYDARDRLIATERRPAPGAGEAPAPTVVHRGYDLNGNPTRVSSPRDEAWLTRYVYDGHDRLEKELRPLRRESEPGEEPITEDLTVERTYFPGGLAKLERYRAPLPHDAEPDAEPEVLFEAEREYDDLAYLVKLKEGFDPQGETGYEPDRAGRVTKRTDRRTPRPAAPEGSPDHPFAAAGVFRQISLPGRATKRGAIAESWGGLAPRPIRREGRIPVLLTEALSLEPQTLFAGRYRIVQRLGEKVYEVVDERTGEPRALKLLSGRSAEELEAEAEQIAEAASLSHPNIVRTFAFEPEPVPHYTMEYVQGVRWREFFERLPADPRVRASWVEATTRQVFGLLMYLRWARLEVYQPIREDNVRIAGGAVKYFGATGPRPAKWEESFLLELGRLGEEYRSGVAR